MSVANSVNNFENFVTQNIQIGKTTGASTGASNGSIIIGNAAQEDPSASGANVLIGPAASFAAAMTGSATTAVGFAVISGQGAAAYGGQNSVFLGAGSGLLATSSSFSSYVGFVCGVDGDNNVGLGCQALQTTNGGSNVACGYFSLNATTGSNNVCLGYQSGSSLGSGGSNCLIGYQSGSAYTSTESNNTLLGASITGIAAESNVIRIGNSSNTNCFLSTPLATTPPSSSTATSGFGSSLTSGTSKQNTLGYNIHLNIIVQVTMAVGGTITLGVGPTSTPSVNTVVPAFTVAALTFFKFSAIVPNSYYVLVNMTGTITISSISAQANPL